MRTWIDRGWQILFWGLLALQVAAIWWFPYFPTQDGPSHLDNAAILRFYSRPDLTVFREYFTVNHRLSPNWVAHLVLAALTGVANPAAAEKILLTAYILLVAFAFRYVLRAVHHDAEPLAVLCFPLLGHCLLQYGFYGFCLSIGIYFLALGYWLRHRESFGLHEIPAFTALSLLLYFSHLVSWALLLGSVGLLSIWLLLSRRVQIAPVLASLMSFLPAAILAVIFLVRPGAMPSNVPSTPIAARWDALRHLSTAIFSYDAADVRISTALAAFFGLITAICAFRKSLRRNWTVDDGLLLVPIAILLLYFMAPPAASGGYYLLERLQLYVFLTLIVWLGAQPKIGTATFFAIQAGAVVFTVLLLALNLPRYRDMNTYLEEYVSVAPFIQPNTTLLPLILDAPAGQLGRLYTRPLAHASGYVTASRHALNLDNYEAQVDFFPIQFRPERNTAVFLGSIETAPPHIDMQGYERRTGARIDSLLLWSFSGRASSIEPGYHVVFQSTAGHLRLYRRDESVFIRVPSR